MPVSATLAGALSFALGMSLGANAILAYREPGSDDQAAVTDDGADAGRASTAEAPGAETRPA